MTLSSKQPPKLKYLSRPWLFPLTHFLFVMSPESLISTSITVAHLAFSLHYHYLHHHFPGLLRPPPL